MRGKDALALAAVADSFERLEVSDASLEHNLVPTLVIVGEHDPERPTAEQWKGVFQNMKMTVIEDADHGQTIRGEQFVEFAVQFIDEISSD